MGRSIFARVPLTWPLKALLKRRHRARGPGGVGDSAGRDCAGPPNRHRQVRLPCSSNSAGARAGWSRGQAGRAVLLTEFSHQTPLACLRRRPEPAARPPTPPHPTHIHTHHPPPPPLPCSFGEVFRGIWRQTDVAVKRLLDQEVSSQVQHQSTPPHPQPPARTAQDPCRTARCVLAGCRTRAVQGWLPVPANRPASAAVLLGCCWLLVPLAQAGSIWRRPSRRRKLPPAPPRLPRSSSPGCLQMLEEFRQEISIMKRLRHPHIVQFVSGQQPRPPGGRSACLAWGACCAGSCSALARNRNAGPYPLGPSRTLFAAGQRWPAPWRRRCA